jgi:threonine aldolase
VQAATTLAADKGLARHLDGARLFNAATAQAALSVADRQPGAATHHAAPAAAIGSGMPGAIEPGGVYAEARRIAQCFDSVSVCFSKGLGAPVGSALCGRPDVIARARRWRKMAGGAMRQSGLLAAAALHALDHHVERLADDHANARLLAEGLQGLSGVQAEPPQTNMVFVKLSQQHGADVVERLRRNGLLCTGLYDLRLVTHLDVSRTDVERAIAIFRQTLQEPA